MWFNLFTTQKGNICVRFGIRILRAEVCVASRPLFTLLRQHSATTAVGILLPLVIQLYLEKRKKAIMKAPPTEPEK